MKRRTSESPIRILTFPCGRASDAALVREILLESNRYYNALVELERERRDRYAAIRREYCPELAGPEQELARAQAAVDDAFRAVNEHKATRYRRTRVKSDEVPEELRATERAAKEARKVAATRCQEIRKAFEATMVDVRNAFQERKKARARELDPKNATPHATHQARARDEVFAAMQGEDWPGAWKRVGALDVEMVAKSKALRKRFTLAAGNSTDAATRFAAARDKRLKETGQPPKFRAFDGCGKIVAHLQKKSGVDLTWQELWSDKWALSMRRAPARAMTSKSRRPEPTARTSETRERVPETERYAIASLFARDPKTGEKRRIEWPVKINRIVPADAAVKGAWISVRERGAVLQVVVEDASFAVAKRAPGVGTVAVHCGWRLRDGGAVRVATWVGDDGVAGEILLPERLMRNLDRPDLLQGFRDMHRVAFVRVIEHMARATGSRLSKGERDTRRQARRHALLAISDAYVAHVLGDRRFVLWSDWKASLRGSLGATLPDVARWARARGLASASERLAWYLWVAGRQILHLAKYESGERAASANRRRYEVRREVIRLATRYDRIVTDDVKFSELSRRGEGTETEDDMPDRSRYLRKLASPGEARATMRDVFGVRGVVVSCKGATQACAACGAELVGPAEASVRECPTHGAVDVDVNHCRNLLARAGISVPERTSIAAE